MNNNTIIKYFNRKRSIAAFLVFVYAFAIGFIFLVNPFNVKSWIDWEDTDDYVITVLSVVGIGFFVLLASRSLMYILRNKVVLNFRSFLIWIAGELAVLSAFYTYFAHEYDPNYIGQGYFDIFPRIFMYVALLLLVPYIISWMYVALKVKKDHEDSDEMSSKVNDADDGKSDMTRTISETELLLKEGSQGHTVPERREVGQETAYDAVGIVGRTREGEADRDRFLAIESIDDRSETQDHGREAQVKVIGI